MIIRGRFIGDAPYFAVHLRSAYFQGLVWLLADTGASRTTILDCDVKLLGIPAEALEPALLPIVGIGGSVRSFLSGKGAGSDQDNYLIIVSEPPINGTVYELKTAFLNPKISS